MLSVLTPPYPFPRHGSGGQPLPRKTAAAASYGGRALQDRAVLLTLNQEHCKMRQ